MVNDERVDIDAFRTALLFIYNGYKNVFLTTENVQAVLYIGTISLKTIKSERREMEQKRFPIDYCSKVICCDIQMLQL